MTAKPRPVDAEWVSDADRQEYVDRFAEGEWYIFHIKKADVELLAQGIISEAVQETCERLIKP